MYLSEEDISLLETIVRTVIEQELRKLEGLIRRVVREELQAEIKESEAQAIKAIIDAGRPRGRAEADSSKIVVSYPGQAVCEKCGQAFCICLNR